MKMRTLGGSVCGVLGGMVIVLACLSSVALAASRSGAPPRYPEAWLSPAKTASQLNLTEFHESPLLMAKDLPPVKERLPEDPIVIAPYDSIGRYGGTARLITEDVSMFFSPEGLFTIAPDHKTILPNLAESYQYSADGRELTVRLRRGLKWSDGRALTAADFLFAVNDLQLNTSFQPVTPPEMIGLTLSAVDPWTLVYTFLKPSPFFVNNMAQQPERYVAPRHYLQQFHPSYADPNSIATRLGDTGFINWQTFIAAALQQRRIPELTRQPTLRAFMPVQFTPTQSTYVRNPYYFKIDPAGQQLPYVDAIEAQVVGDTAVAVAKASTGQLDFAGFRLPTQDIPLLKLGEKSSGIQVKIWRRLHGSDLAIQANMNHADERLRSLFQDVRFRRALSVAIDRDEMNEIIYFGRGVPRQVTVIPESDYFEPHFATAYTKYQPLEAKRLLDEIGLLDVDADGMREFPDGSKFIPTFEYVDTETPKQISMELIASYWNAVGIDVRPRLIDRGLQLARAMSNEFVMTLWHADRTTDILFPGNPDFWVPRKIAASLAMWSEWSRWYLTNGEKGDRPPPEILELQRIADEFVTTMDSAHRVQLGKQILATNAEQLWTIGTVGLAPQPIVVSERLKNVVDEGLWGWDIRGTMPYHPSTWYFDR
ncbi:MAG: ABC transporter substrate-binding protein [bacterium]